MPSETLPAARPTNCFRYIDRVPVREKSLIERIRKLARTHRHGAVIHGIGDDCAILRIPPGHEALVTTDFTLEDVHFLREWHRAEVVGRRCLTRGLSDIAAMGGQPIAAFLSLALPKEIPHLAQCVKTIRLIVQFLIS